MIRDQDSILDHLQPSKLLDIWMHTQISRATRVLILNVSDKFIGKCRRSRLFGEWHLGKMGLWDMATLVSFWRILENRMANFGLTDFKLGLYIKINVNAGKNKFEVHI